MLWFQSSPTAKDRGQHHPGPRGHLSFPVHQVPGMGGSDMDSTSEHRLGGAAEKGKRGPSPPTSLSQHQFSLPLLPLPPSSSPVYTTQRRRLLSWGLSHPHTQPHSLHGPPAGRRPAPPSPSPPARANGSQMAASDSASACGNPGIPPSQAPTSSCSPRTHTGSSCWGTPQRPGSVGGPRGPLAPVSGGTLPRQWDPRERGPQASWGHVL